MELFKIAVFHLKRHFFLNVFKTTSIHSYGFYDYTLLHFYVTNAYA